MPIHEVNTPTAATTHASEFDQSLSTTSGDNANPITGQLTGIRTLAQPALRTAIRNELGERTYQELSGFLDKIDRNGGTDLNRLQQDCESFIQQHIHNPKLITKVLSYINSQAMMMDSLEKNIQAHKNKAEGRLYQGVQDFVERTVKDHLNTQKELKKAKISPVFTAHPTNLSRPNASDLVYRSPSIRSNASLQSLGQFSDGSGTSPSRSPQGERDATSQSPGSSPSTSPSDLGHLPNALWNEQGRRNVRPTVIQEAEGYQVPLQNLQKASHQIHKAIDQQLHLLTGEHLQEPLITTGNWVGGDRDGNSFVTADTLRSSVALYSDSTFNNYARKLSDSKLGAKLNGNSNPNLRTLIQTANQDTALIAIQDKLSNTQNRIRAGVSPSTFTDSLAELDSNFYSTPDQFIADLKGLDFSSLPPLMKEQAERKIRSLVIDIKAHGFHGATTDIRQNSAINEKTVDILLRLSGVRSDYRSLPEADKRAVLKERLNSPDGDLLNDNLDQASDEVRQQILKDYKPHEIEDFKREVELIRAYKDIHDQFGKAALENCITANTETVSDLMEVMVLLRHAQVAGPDFCDMKIVGLIETVDDLKNGPEILNGLLSDPWYKSVLNRGDQRQMVMVGYSDSDRLAGSMSSNWAVYKGTLEMMQIGEKHGIQLEYFHGRGGTEARGAGKNYSDEISVHDGRSLVAGFRQTEQGEEVNAKFGNVEIANASLDQMVGATLSRVAKGGDQQQFETYSAVMDQLADHAEAKYKDLYNNPNLGEFYESSTPINHIKHSNAGSRPAKRAEPQSGPKKLNIDELRAIPWVASWMQCRAMVPGFFGTGTAIEAYLNDAGGNSSPTARMETLRDMYQTWPIVKNLVDRTEMALAKADMGIARMYAGTGAENEAIMSQIEAEHTKTTTYINAIKQQTELLQNRPDEKSSLKVRGELLNWSNALQAKLLKQAQANPDLSNDLVEPIVVSMQAVANGLGRFG
ncbi:MAG: phosphoenolpyruvate carboxylase [Limnobacter sp.]|nr:phosphoenolpyruvate carboxylase [Limnobacter sp.]